MAEREVRYCTTEDGVRIAYCVEGEGPPIVAIPFFLDSFSLDRLVPEIADALRAAAQGCSLIRFDTRGTGLSQREVADLSSAALRLDVDAVVHELGLEQISIISSAIGTLRALDYAVNRPEYVGRMALYAPLARVFDAFPEDLVRGFISLARSNWRLASRTFADLGVRRDSEEFGLRFAELLFESASGEVVASFMETNMHIDLTPKLPNVMAPALLIYDTNFTAIPIDHGQRLSTGIPDVRLIALPKASLAALFDREALGRANNFLRESEGPESPADRYPAGAFRTVLFTDLVGHAEMMGRLGDEAGRVVLREHERITREVLKEHGGQEIKTMGDGFMASFGSVTKAVESAIALQRAFAAHTESMPEPLHVRVGLNAGEPIAEEGDLFGATVILAARIAAQAGAGEILIPEPVRHLLAGKGFVFSDKGEFVPKGFDDAVRLYEVRWRD
jgi:class 3 adenylate cyclase